MSEHVVKFHVVDFISSTRLEALLNYRVLGVRHTHLEIVEDGAEASKVDKS